MVGCPIRISTDQFVCANPRSFSQLITSFFASESHRHPPYALILLIVLYVSVYKIQTTYAFYIFLVFSYLNMSMNFYLLDTVIGLCGYLLKQITKLPNKRITRLVENIGVEPMTSCVQGRRSSQLS